MSQCDCWAIKPLIINEKNVKVRMYFFLIKDKIYVVPVLKSNNKQNILANKKKSINYFEIILVNIKNHFVSFFFVDYFNDTIYVLEDFELIFFCGFYLQYVLEYKNIIKLVF